MIDQIRRAGRQHVTARLTEDVRNRDFAAVFGVMRQQASNNGESSSLREPTQHLLEFPAISFAARQVEAKRLDDLDCFARASMIQLDVQGNELDVLRSGSNVGLGHLFVIICEYSLVPLYEGSGVLSDIQRFLETEGFELAFTTSPYFSGSECIGDAVFVRRGMFTSSQDTAT